MHRPTARFFNLINWSLILGTGILCTAAPAVSEAAEAAPTKAYQTALKSGGPSAAAAALLARLAASPNPEANVTAFLELIPAIVEKTDTAHATPIAIVAALRDSRHDTEAAELLFYLAPFNNGQDWIPAYLNDAQRDQAAALLTSPDPFTAGIAAWALHATVTKDNDRGIQRWPTPDAPAWFQAYAALPPSQLTALEHIYQVVNLGRHRSATELRTDLEARLESARQLASHLGPGHAGHAEALGLLATCRPAVLAEAADLTAARIAYLAQRQVIRSAVIALTQPDVPALAYIERRGFVGQHNISGGSPSPTRHPPGTDLLIDTDLDPATPPRRVLGDQLGPGAIRGLDLFYDASRFVFAFASIPEWSSSDNHYGVQEWKIKGAVPQDLYEIRPDGTGLRRLTTDTTWNDTEPTYLPDGSIVFASDRGGAASQCGTWEQSTASLNLYRLWPEQARIKRLTYNKDFDRYPHVLPNGLIGFLRWDYQERHLFQPHGLWTIRPDGTNPDAFYKQHLTTGPLSLRDAMPVTGSTKLFAIGTGHHHIPEGALIRVNPDFGVNNLKGMELFTPSHSPVQDGIDKAILPPPGGGARTSFQQRGGWFQTPWPLDENRVLVAHSPHLYLSAGHRLIYLDAWGNQELVAQSPYREIAYPIVVKPRPFPQVIAEHDEGDRQSALTYVDNVYDDLPGVQPGTAKFIRISTRPDWPYFKDEYGALRWLPDFGFNFTFGYWSWSPARTIGTVPVEPDGSALFKVPARMPVYFQLLDENKMEIRRMRSHVEFQRGEFRSCIGCHETRTGDTGNLISYREGLALKRPPSTPVPPPFGANQLIDFERHIQPIFDRACVSCHGTDQPAGGLELTSRTDGFGFMQSYRSLFGLKWGDPLPMKASTQKWFAQNSSDYTPDKPTAISDERKWKGLDRAEPMPDQLVSIINRQANASISQPYELGSTRSKLATTLRDDPAHRASAKLTPAEWETLVTWIDAGAPYSGQFYLKQGPEGKLLPHALKIDVTYPDPWIDPGEFSAVGRPVVPPDLSPGPGHEFPAK